MKKILSLCIVLFLISCTPVKTQTPRKRRNLRKFKTEFSEFATNKNFNKNSNFILFSYPNQVQKSTNFSQNELSDLERIISSELAYNFKKYFPKQKCKKIEMLNRSVAMDSIIFINSKIDIETNDLKEESFQERIFVKDQGFENEVKLMGLEALNNLGCFISVRDISKSTIRRKLNVTSIIELQVWDLSTSKIVLNKAVYTKENVHPRAIVAGEDNIRIAIDYLVKGIGKYIESSAINLFSNNGGL